MSFNGVAQTSLLVAGMRALETKRTEAEGRLFSDPFAEILAADEGKDILEHALAQVGDQPVIAVRTYYIDNKLKAALDDGIKQIVILASGMDARAYRLDFPNDVELFELDQKEVLEYKKKQLLKANAVEKVKLRSIAVDLVSDWTLPLVNAGFDKNKKTLWLVEGLIMYLNEKDVMALFQKISILSQPGSLAIFDLMGKSLIEAPFMKKQLDFLANLGAPWLYGHDSPEEFMEAFGWSVEATLPSEVMPSRWPFPSAPRNVPGVPRSYFVKATKK